MSSTDQEVLVRVNGVSKKFCRDLKKSLWYGLKDVASELLPGSSGNAQGIKHKEPELRPGEFWANKDISFELRRGECLGLIGRNGAGKTTLLKMLNGLIKPDSGSIEMRGRVGALIALGAGFNPILTGRENIHVNGSILGLTKEEIDAKMDDIIEFAEIPDFIDSPVQSYSSGMQVRLGFAVATALEPDVLILDEVLAVGDAAFRNKCYNRISKLRKKAAVIFVSHSMAQVGLICDKCVTLSKGKIQYLGATEGGIASYESLNSADDCADKSFSSFHYPVALFSAKVADPNVGDDRNLVLEIDVELMEKLPDALLRILIYNNQNAIISAGDYEFENRDDLNLVGANHWTVDFPPLTLRKGGYKLGINLITGQGDIVAWSFKEIEIQVIRAETNAFADHQLNFAVAGKPVDG